MCIWLGPGVGGKNHYISLVEKYLFKTKHSFILVQILNNNNTQHTKRVTNDQHTNKDVIYLVSFITVVFNTVVRFVAVDFVFFFYC